MTSSSFEATSDAIKQHLTPAIVTASVQLLGLGLCIVVWADYLMLEPYGLALLWAVLCSIPLHRVKTGLLEFFYCGGVYRLQRLAALGRATLGPIWTVGANFFFVASGADADDADAGEGDERRDAPKAEPPSAPYFRVLVSLFVVYGAFRLGRVVGWLPLFSVIGTAVLAGFVGHVLLRRASRRRGTAAPKKEGKEKHKAGASSEKQPKARTKDRRRWPSCADQLAATVLIILFLAGSATLSVMFAVRVAQESRELFGSTEAFLIESVPPGLGEDIRTSISIHEESIKQSLERVQEWLIDGFQEAHPDVNVTALLRIGVMLSAYVLGTPPGVNGSQEASVTGTPSAIELLPVSKQLFGNLSTGNLLAAIMLLPASFSELRAAIATRGAEAVMTEHFKSIGAGVGRVGAFVARYALSLVTGFLWLFAAGFSLLLQFLIFCTALFYLLVARSSVIDTLGDALTSVLGTDELVVSIGRSINAVFASTFKLFFFHALSTGLLFQVFSINLVVLSAILSGLSAAFPFVSTLIIPILAVPQLLIQGRLIVLAIVIAVHFFIWWTIDTMIYSEIPGSHTMLAGISVVLGLTAFGLHGVLLGPILVCIPVIVFDFWTQSVKQLTWAKQK